MATPTSPVIRPDVATVAAPYRRCYDWRVLLSPLIYDAAEHIQSRWLLVVLADDWRQGADTNECL